MQSHWDDRRLGVHLSCRSLKEDRLVPPGSPVSLLTRTSLVRPRSRPNAAKHLAAQFTQDTEFSIQINPATQQIACKNTDALLCTPCAEARGDGGRFGRHITPPCAVADKGTRPAHNVELAPRGPKTPRAQRGAFADLWGALHALGAHPLYASIRLSSVVQRRVMQRRVMQRRRIRCCLLQRRVMQRRLVVSAAYVSAHALEGGGFLRALHARSLRSFWRSPDFDP